MSQHAELIIVGTVKKAEPGRWMTESGQLPEGATVNTIPSGILIYTDFIVTVGEVLKGESRDKNVRVRSLGGTVGEDSMIAEDEAMLTPGSRVLLFLNADSLYEEFGPSHYTVEGLIQGAYEIKGDQTIAMGNPMPLDQLLSIIAENR